jgi:nicotinamidase/pyrazinamidase
MFFWDEDTQVDFLYPEGKLYVPGAEALIPNLERLTQWAQKHGVLVLASVDAHRLETTPEFNVYPPHCLVGTPGQQKIPQTLLGKRRVVPNRLLDTLPDLRQLEQVIVEKDSLDIFDNPNIEALLARLGAGQEVILYGVVTEICVAYAARGLLDRGFRLRLVRDAVHHLDEAKGRALLAEVEQRGGRLVTTEEVVSLAA